MPNKTIYVSDKDLPLYTRAQELAGGNLSAAISKALRRYVDAEEGKLEGFKEITVKVGVGKGRKQRFSGTLLADWVASDGKRAEVYKVYGTRNGKYAVHLERTTNFNWDVKEGGWKKHLGIGPQTYASTQPEATLRVAENLDELSEMIPAELYEMVADMTNQPVEDLDI